MSCLGGGGEASDHKSSNPTPTLGQGEAGGRGWYCLVISAIFLAPSREAKFEVYLFARFHFSTFY